MVLEETITQYFRFIRSDHLERRGSALPAQIHRIARRTGVVRLGGERARAPICGGESTLCWAARGVLSIAPEIIFEFFDCLQLAP
jgi:hypothetical protein